MARHPRTFALVGRALTAPPLSPLLSRGWSVYWNDLVREASPGGGKIVASSLDLLVSAGTSLSASRRRTLASLDAAVQAAPTARGDTLTERPSR
jgi:hypothetical protein